MATRYGNDRDYGGHPLVATIIAALILLLPLGAIDHHQNASAAFRLGLLVGKAISGPLMVWGIAYWITIRKASPRWKAGSLVALMIIGILVALIEAGRPGVTLQQDTENANRVFRDVAARGGAVSGVPINPEDGPLTRMQATMLDGMIVDGKAFDREALAAGINDLDLDTVTKSSPVLARCDGIAALRARADFYKERIETYVGVTERIGQQAVAAGQLPDDALRGFDKAMHDKRPMIERRWDIKAGIAEETAGICRLLRAQDWHARDGRILFNNQRQADAMNERMARIEAYRSEMDGIRRDALVNLRSTAADSGQ